MKKRDIVKTCPRRSQSGKEQCFRPGLFDKISVLIEQARKKVAVTINQEMVVLYWNIGKTVKEEIMKSERAEYGKQIVQSLTAQLLLKYGRGFSSQNLWHMIKFNEIYPILSAVQREFEKLSYCFYGRTE